MTDSRAFQVIDTRNQPDGKVFDTFRGADYGAMASFFIEDTDEEGYGPFLHQHPYSETFVVQSGKALLTVGDDELLGLGGMILVVPKFTPHKFSVIGPERYQALHIHESDTFITEWLEGPRSS